MLIDSHYHFDFIKDSAVQSEFVEHLNALDIQLVAQTVLPSQFEQVYQLAQAYAQSGWTLRPALGWHPWWIESRDQFEVETAIFQAMLSKTRSIGEIGLDDARKEIDEAGRQLQREVFERILNMMSLAKKIGNTSSKKLKRLLAQLTYSSTMRECQLCYRQNIPRSKIIYVL